MSGVKLPVQRAWRAAMLAFLAATIIGLGSAHATGTHPIHTTLAQISYDSASRAIGVSLRVFADDFGVAVGRHSRVPPGADDAVPAAAAYAYVQSAFSLADAAGKRIVLEGCGVRRAGAVVWICLRAPAPHRPRGLRVLSALLFEVHDDQVNLVQSTTSGRNTSALFTRGDRPRPLP